MMHKLIYEPLVLTLYAYSVEVGYAMSENGEQYGGGGSNPPYLIPPEGYGNGGDPSNGPTGGPDPYTNGGGWWTGE